MIPAPIRIPAGDAAWHNRCKASGSTLFRLEAPVLPNFAMDKQAQAAIWTRPHCRRLAVLRAIPRWRLSAASARVFGMEAITRHLPGNSHSPRRKGAAVLAGLPCPTPAPPPGHPFFWGAPNTRHRAPLLLYGRPKPVTEPEGTGKPARHQFRWRRRDLALICAQGRNAGAAGGTCG